jgi:FkbM family methyltransferase
MLYLKHLIGYLRLDDGVFIDVGANLGKYTIAVARELGNKGVVVAIEPNPDVYERLLLNIKLNRLTNVIPLNVAADSQNRKVHLFVNSIYHGSSSLLAKEKELPFIEVTAKRLDDIISELGIYSGIRLVKIDVEGWEAEVLKGMREILRSCRPKIIFEAWDESHLRDVEEELKEFGYEIRPIAEFNYLALPKEDFNL